jgi:hypothetical protein
MPVSKWFSSILVSLERGIRVSSKRATRASVENIKTKILRNPGT